MNEIDQLPKVELHAHIDCSLSFHAVKKMIPGITKSKYISQFIAPAKCLNLSHYLECAQFAVNLLQTKKNLEIAVEDLMVQQADDGVIYSELRFSPFEHTKQGLGIEEVVRIVLHTMIRVSEKNKIISNLILCTLRHYSSSQSMETAAMVEKYYGNGIVALDLASDEANYPIDAHIDAFDALRKTGIPTTAHAGEAAGPESVLETLNLLHPARIGHGVRAIEDSKVVAKILQNNIHLEVCPSSNIQTNVYSTYSDHVVNQLKEKGFSFGINTDARAITSISLNAEYKKLVRHFGWNHDDFYLRNTQALKHAFISEDLRAILMEKLGESHH